MVAYQAFSPLLPIIGVFAVQITLASLWCKLAHQWYFSFNKAQKTAVIYDMREGMDQLISEYGLEKRFRVTDSADVNSALNEGLQILDDIDVVFLCGVHSHERNIILKQCVARGIQMYLIPRIGDVIMSGARRMHMFHLPMLQVGRYNPTPEYLFIKRAFDIIVSGLALIIFFRYGSSSSGD